MYKFIIVFNKDDKEKLIKKGFSYIKKQGKTYVFKNNSNIHLSDDIITMPTNNVYL